MNVKDLSQPECELTRVATATLVRVAYVYECEIHMLQLDEQKGIPPDSLKKNLFSMTPKLTDDI